MSLEKFSNWDRGRIYQVCTVYQGCVGSFLFIFTLSLCYELLKMAHIEIKLNLCWARPGSGIYVSFRQWVVRKFAIHEHLYFACSVFKSPGFGWSFNTRVWQSVCYANIMFGFLQLPKVFDSVEQYSIEHFPNCISRLKKRRCWGMSVWDAPEPWPSMNSG